MRGLRTLKIDVSRVSFYSGCSRLNFVREVFGEYLRLILSDVKCSVSSLRGELKGEAAKAWLSGLVIPTTGSFG